MSLLILFLMMTGYNSEGTPPDHVPPNIPRWDMARAMATECHIQDFQCGLLVGKTILNRKEIAQAKTGRKVSIKAITETAWQFSGIHKNRQPSQNAMNFFLPIADGLLHSGTHFALCSTIRDKKWGREGLKKGYFDTSDGHCWIIDPMAFPLPYFASTRQI